MSIVTETKQALMTAIATIAADENLAAGTPLTDLKLDQTIADQLEIKTLAVEAENPNPNPLKTCPEFLDGAWLLIYSTAREIQVLNSLPLGFQLGRVYQVIDVATKGFYNQAFCKHATNFVEGYVTVNATFSVAPTPADGIPDRKINVDFNQRSIFITKILGLPFFSKKAISTVSARNPVGRIPSLTLTYLDEDFRIGRGGDGSLFILKKVTEIKP
ncbi:PAP fibrillin [[Leptolyngbya] sp. PCC 7376]|uniref:PAP/fibrillin family protein n=1 Tax=[Leptolyngbya] sp. PCC 7376 TaxID=111781 RepID=UPI00029EEAB5|nr:PAP/fibrillin family protein [[Leptolyngbya] sp. PCC 7376]AFY38455.1 PAP fibrillin [[Leptolyngbya] sp. PCC 7376]